MKFQIGDKFTNNNGVELELVEINEDEEYIISYLARKVSGEWVV